MPFTDADVDVSLYSDAPFAEPSWYCSNVSTYYNASHRRLLEEVRTYVDQEMRENAHEWEQQGEVPEAVYKRHAQFGFLVTMPPKKEYMGKTKLPANIPVEEWDEFHNLIMIDELSRIGYWGVVLGLGQGNSMACPAIQRFGTEEQKLFYLPRVASGEIRFCYAITEPDAGSDVANIKTTATRENDFYVVEGIKKWVTSGIFSQFCLAAVRTGGPGRDGLSLLVIPLTTRGVTARRMETSGVKASGSTLIEFDNVRVPKSCLIGKENDGWSMIMSNFNYERTVLACAALRLSRVCAEDAYNHSIVRETFGQKLISHALIRAKITQFGIDIEPAFGLLEQLTFRMKYERLNPEKSSHLAGMTALLKIMSMRTLERCVREAQQILGGIGYTKGGRGGRVEQISRDVRMLVVGGGSEEVMIDLALRQQQRDLKMMRRAQGPVGISSAKL